jgi:spore coat protein U-like protein
MRILTAAFIAITLTTLFFASSALAATQDLNVTAKVVGHCAFDGATPVDFGDLDQTSAADATATGDLTFWCTNNSSYTLGDETNSTVGDGTFAGALTPIGPSLDTIDYTLAYTNFNGSGAGKTAPITSAITANIVNADYVNVEADTYTDTVTFTILP